MKRLLFLIFFLAIIFRLIGIYPGHSRYHPDETIIYGVAIEMVKSGDLNPKRFDYGGGAIYINYIAYKFFFVPLSWSYYYATHLLEIVDGTLHIPISPLEKNSIFQKEILGEREINAMYWGRIVSAFFGICGVFLTYILGRKLFGVKVSIIATLFLAVSFRHVTNSHIGLPDIYNSFFLLWGAIAAYDLWQNPTKKNYLVAGIAAGLCYSVKYQFFVFVVISVAHLLQAFESKKYFVKSLINRNVFIAVFSAALIFLLINPFLLSNIKSALSELSYVSLKYGLGTMRVNLFPLSYLFNHDIGPVLFTLALFGIVRALIKDSKKAILLLSIVAPFYFIFAYYSTGGFYIRNNITIVPFLLIFASYCVYTIFNNKNFLLVGVVLLAIAFPLKNTLVHLYYYCQPWNYLVLSQWLYKNWDSKWIVASHPFDPPTGAPEMKKTEFEITGNYSMSEHKDAGAAYSILNLDWGSNTFYNWMFFGLNNIDRFLNKPLEEMRNSYFGLAAEELFRYQIYSITKPWQAADAALVVSKFPIWPNTKFNIIVTNGVLEINTESNEFGNEKSSLDRISVTPGFLYKVTATLETEELLNSKNRDGFVRLDFYSKEKRIVSSVSSRMSEKGKKTVAVLERAPAGADSLVVSVQSSSPNSSFIAREIVVLKSESMVEDIVSKEPYNIKPIDLNLLYPNSHGNL